MIKLNCWIFRSSNNFFIIFFTYIKMSKDFFFFQGFLWRTLTTHRTAGEGRGPSFIPLYHFHSLTNIHTFICNSACEMTIKYFSSHRLYLPGCYSMIFTNLSNYDWTDWWCDVRFSFFTCSVASRFCYSNLTRETGGLKLASTITLVLQANRKFVKDIKVFLKKKKKKSNNMVVNDTKATWTWKTKACWV